MHRGGEPGTTQNIQINGVYLTKLQEMIYYSETLLKLKDVKSSKCHFPFPVFSSMPNTSNVYDI